MFPKVQEDSGRFRKPQEDRGIINNDAQDARLENLQVRKKISVLNVRKMQNTSFSKNSCRLNTRDTEIRYTRYERPKIELHFASLKPST